MGSEDDFQTWARRGAARRLALYVYLKPLVIVAIVVAALFLFGGAEARGRTGFSDILGSGFLGIFAAWLVKDLVLWRLLVKKFDKAELRALWLEFGGFSE